MNIRSIHLKSSISSTIPTCVFYNAAGDQVDTPTGADSMTLTATTTKMSLFERIVIASGLTPEEVHRWWAEKGVAGMKSGQVTSTAVQVFRGSEQGTTPIHMVPVGGACRFGELPQHAKRGGLMVHRFIADGTDELLIFAGPCWFYGSRVITIDATPVYPKHYDKVSAPDENDTPTSGTGSPANATAALAAGNNGILPNPVEMFSGLGVRAVTGLADNSDAALTAAENIIETYWSPVYLG